VPENTPLSLRLLQYHLNQLLGDKYQALLQCIHALENDEQKTALIEDKHTANCAGLFLLMHHEFPSYDADSQKAIMEVLAHCAPPYHLAHRDDPITALQTAQTLLEKSIEPIRQSHWSMRNIALEYLQQLHQDYMSVSADFDTFGNNPALQRHYQQRASLALLGAGYYHLDIETARRLLCINEYGDEVKKNEAGSHAVCAANGIHYKPNPKGTPEKPANPINPGKEYLVSALMQLIAGHQLAAAPSSLLSIQGVPIQSSSESSDLATTPITTEGLVQAGLTVQGMCFKDYLECRETVQQWRLKIGQHNTEILLTDCQQQFKQSLAIAQQHFPQVLAATTEETQHEALRIAFESLCSHLPQEQQLTDIAKNHGRPENSRAHAFRGLLVNYLHFGGQLEKLHVLLGVIVQYPTIMQAHDIACLLQQLKQVQHIFKLFPYLPISAALAETDKILTDKYLDTEATSALWLGLLLSLPCDAKFDNFMLELHYNNAKQLQSCRIVAIDNDLSLKMPFSLNENKALCLEVKNLLVTLPELMNLPVHPAIQKRFLATSADSQWLTWLCIAARRNSDYQTWQAQGTVTLQKLQQIDIPVKLPRHVMLFVKQQWQKLQHLLRNNPAITHGECFEQLYPAVAVAYQQLMEKTASPLSAEALLYQIFGMNGCCPIEMLGLNEHRLTHVSDSQLLHQNIIEHCDCDNTRRALLCSTYTDTNTITTEEQPSRMLEPSYEAPIAIADFCHSLLKDRVLTIRFSAPSDSEKQVIHSQQGVLVFKKNEQFYVSYVNIKNHHYQEKQLDPEKEATLCTLFSTIQTEGQITDVPLRNQLFTWVIHAGGHAPVQAIHWQTMSATDTWGIIQAFSLLPELTLKDWQGNNSRDVSPSIQAWFQQTVAYASPFVAQQMLNLGAHVSTCDESKQTVLHIFCRNYLHYPNSETVALMAEVLLSHHSCQPNQYNAHGYTPLLQWINATPEPHYLKPDELKSAELLLDALITHGVNLEAKDSVKHETALDKTLKPGQEKPHWFVKLIERGAGIHANGKRLLAFELAMQKVLLDTPELPQCFDILAKRNLSVAWHSSQRIFETKKSKTARILVRGAEIGEVYLPIAIEERLLTAKQTFNIAGDTTEYGRRVVKVISYQHANWHIKKHPEMPGVETAVKTFAQQLLGEHTAPNELFAFFEQKGNPYPVLISQTVPGENLQQVLNLPSAKTNAVLNALDVQSLSEQILLAMLIHPEDGKPDNYQVLPTEHEGQPPQCRIVGVDNDHAFVKAVTSNQGKRELQVKCVLFCFDAMRKPVHSAVRERLLALSADTFLEEWLTQLQAYQTQSMQLFDKNSRKGLFKSKANVLKVALRIDRERLPVVVTIPFRPKAISELWDRFTRLQHILRKQPTISHLQLLKGVTPALGVRYEEVFELYEEPNQVAERFHDIAKTHYSTAIAGRYATLTTSRQELEAMGLSAAEQKILVQEEGNAALSPHAALQELKQTIAQKTKIKSIIERIQAGEFERFREVLSEQLKEYILSQLDFSQMILPHSQKPDIKKQEALLTIIVLENIPFQTVTIQHCAALTDEYLIALLKNSPGLKKLKLVDCPQLTEKISVAIEKYTPTLVSLTLLYLPNLLAIGKKVMSRLGRKIDYEPINLQQLTRLNVSELLHCERIAIQCPHLTLATTKRNPQLMEVSLFSEKLNAWDLSYCDAFTDGALTKTTWNYLFLPRLNIQGCKNIQSRIFHYLSDNNMSGLVRMLSNEKWRQRTSLFERCLSAALFRFGQETFDVAEITVTSSLLSKNPQLLELDFSDTTINDDDIFVFLEALRTHPTLKVLKITLNDLSVLHSSIVAIFGTNLVLTTFIINGIDGIELRKTLHQQETTLTLGKTLDSEMFVIAALLKTNSVLKILNFSGNQLSEHSIRLLCKSVEENTCLEIVDLRDCDLHDDAAAVLLTLLQKNTILKLINLDGNPCSEKIKHDIVTLCLERCKKKHDNTWLQYYLDTLHLHLAETLDFVTDNAQDLLNWHTLTDAFYRSTHLKTIRWAMFEQNGDAELSSAPPERDSLDGSLNSSRRAETSIPPTTPPCLFTLNRHSDSVLTLTQLQDGCLASGSSDYSIKIWNLNSKACLFTLNGHSNWVNTLTQLQDGCLASGSHDNSIKIWDLNAKACLFTLNGHSNWVNTLTQLQDGCLASGSRDYSIKIWDLNAKACLFTLNGHSNSVTTLTQLQDGCLASGSRDYSIKIWDLNAKACLFTLNGHSFSVYTLTQLQDGCLASGSRDYSIKIWDLNAKACLFTLNGHSNAVTTLTQLQDGCLASGSLDYSIKIWNVPPLCFHSFNIDFRLPLQQAFVLRNNLHSITLALLPHQQPDDSSRALLQSFSSFCKHLLYNCYARNNAFFSVTFEFNQQQLTLNITCPTQSLASNLYLCLEAFFYPGSSLQPFIELLTSTPHASNSPQNRQTIPQQTTSAHHRTAFFALPSSQPLSPRTPTTFARPQHNSPPTLPH
jgi:WD40 repeat protein